MSSVVLSVGDSKILQTAIIRAIGDLYNVQLANNINDVLDILLQEKVVLLLLDNKMPHSQALCRTIRKLSQIKQLPELPIIMLTDKDGFVDR